MYTNHLNTIFNNRSAETLSQLFLSISYVQFAAIASQGQWIVRINIGECQTVICESGGCTNVLHVDERASVVNTKTKSEG